MKAVDAIKWCAENQAIAIWLIVIGTPRVQLRCPGYAMIERDTLEEAVNDLSEMVNNSRARKAGGR